MPELWRALRYRNYKLFFGGQAASLVGMWLQLTAQSWLIYRLTDSATAVGIMTVAQQGPGLLLGPFVGALADRHSKKRILLISQAAAAVPAFALGVLTLSGVVEAWHIVALAFVTGVARAFEIPTRQSFVPELVGRSDLANAIALNSVLFNGARLIGPAIAGIVIATAGEGWCFIANSLSYSAILIALAAIRLPARSDTGERGSLWSEVREGLQHVRGERTLWALLGGLGVVSLAGMPYSVLLPSFSQRVLGGGPDTYGYLQAAVGAGAIAGALALAARRRIRGIERWLVASGVLFGLSLVAVSRAESTQMAYLLLVPMGLGFMVQNASTNTLLQSISPDHLRGRIMSLHTTLFLGLFPLGGFIAGSLADRYGEVHVLAGAGAVVVASQLVFGRILLRTAPAAIDRVESLEAASAGIS